MGLMTFAGALVTSQLVKRLGIRRRCVIAPLVTAAAILWLSHLTADSSYSSSLLVPLLLAGTSIGVTFVPMAMAATIDVRSPKLASSKVSSTPADSWAACLAWPSGHHHDGCGASRVRPRSCTSPL
jgi:predicted MFS family arabinose efflux permease